MAAYRHARARLLQAMSALLVMPRLPALAQALTWSDVPCGDSRLLVADGFRCRATAPYSPDNGRGATYRIHTASATNSEGTTYLYLMEGTDARSVIRLSSAVPEQLSQAIPLAQTGRDWSQVRLHAGSGYALFTAENGDNCVGFRKAGPARGGGHAWAILGIRCAAAGQTLSDTEIVSAIEAARPNEPARTK